MPEEVRKVFGLIKKHNMKNGLTDPDHYLFFSRHGDRMHECSLDKKIYKFCDKLGIQRRSIHEIRKTFISTLLDNKINSDTVRETVGHQDMRTTLNNYYYDRKTEKQIEEQMERIWASNQ